jgi:hypothetical protein
MCVNHLFNLSLIFSFNLVQHILVGAVVLAPVHRSSFLELLQSHLKFLLGFNQITFVIVLLGLKELDFTFPESLISVVSALHVHQFPFSILEFRLKLHQVLS